MYEATKLVAVPILGNPGKPICRDEYLYYESAHVTLHRVPQLHSEDEQRAALLLQRERN